MEIPEFSETGLVKHGFSTRLGGSSQGSFEGLNLGIYNNDALADVRNNREIFTTAVGITSERVVCCHQVHQTEIYPASSADCGKGFWEPETAVAGIDGLMTDQVNVGLMVCFADCTPLFFLDPVAKAIAISHAGWKGTVGGIGAKTVEQMGKYYGSQPENILVGIGPSIGFCHYEVDQPLISAFQKCFDSWPEILHFTDQNRAQLDLWRANQLQLMACGIRERNINVSELCTYSHPELFFSHRRDQGRTGRMAGLIMLTA